MRAETLPPDDSANSAFVTATLSEEFFVDSPTNLRRTILGLELGKRIPLWGGLIYRPSISGRFGVFGSDEGRLLVTPIALSWAF